MAGGNERVFQPVGSAQGETQPLAPLVVGDSVQRVSDTVYVHGYCCPVLLSTGLLKKAKRRLTRCLGIKKERWEGGGKDVLKKEEAGCVAGRGIEVLYGGGGVLGESRQEG